MKEKKKNSLKRISILEWKEFWLWLKEFLGCRKFFIGFLEEVTRFVLSEGKLNESNSSITISNNAMSVKNFTVTAKWEIWGKTVKEIRIQINLHKKKWNALLFLIFFNLYFSIVHCQLCFSIANDSMINGLETRSTCIH